MEFTYTHSSMQSSGDIVVLFQSRAAAEDLWQPELADSTLHVTDLALGQSGSFNPLGRLTADTTHHVGMSKRFGSPLLRLAVKSTGDGLGDARVKRRCPAGDNEVVVALVTGARPSFTVARAGPRE